MSISANDKLKIALVGGGAATFSPKGVTWFDGAGHWGVQHARILSERADVDFCAIVGRHAEKTKARAVQFHVQAYLDVQEMLERAQPDLVCVCLPNQDHYDVTLQLIQAGVPLFVEKPLVFDLAQAKRLISEAAARNLFFGINFNHRYARPVALAHDAIQQGKLGQLVFATWRFGGEGASDHPHANLFETQCHGFDMLEHLCGPVASVMAEMTDVTGNGFNTMALSLKFENGAIGSMVGSYDSSYAYHDTHRVEVNGTDGRVVIVDTVKEYAYQRAGSEIAEIWQAGYFNDVDREFHKTFDRHMDEVICALREGRQPPIHAKAGYRAVLLASAAARSFELGRRVHVAEIVDGK
ncbi:Gfo/Idh/MocA family protein [Alicyclobacillus fodiniaquatilis]|jgi:predicted dehydrogenase|uniref:Gfo/Idh/MocA family protein n=1 Tax=Alicyclobacillus fodiniaquatilis TaxID=1661150 RepID=A0ABW4JM48_9BACL